MDESLYIIAIIVAYFIQGAFLLYHYIKNKERVKTYPEILIESILILIGIYFSYGISVFTNYLVVFIWIFILVFILDLWFRAKLIVKFGNWFIRMFHKK